MEERDHSQKGNVSQLLVIFINSGYVSPYCCDQIHILLQISKSARRNNWCSIRLVLITCTYKENSFTKWNISYFKKISYAYKDKSFPFTCFRNDIAIASQNMS
jgi:hypothetical protein